MSDHGFSASSKRPRVYKRKFDWDEARRRHRAGETLAAIARSYGVHPWAVSRVVNMCASQIVSVSEADLARRGGPHVCPRCRGRKNKKSILCHRCRAAGRYGRSIGEEWDPDDETTLADIWPPTGYLSYQPKNGRFHIVGSFGYSTETSRTVVGDLLLVDCATGDVVEQSPEMPVDEAPYVFERMRARVRKMNQAEAA